MHTFFGHWILLKRSENKVKINSRLVNGWCGYQNSCTLFNKANWKALADMYVVLPKRLPATTTLISLFILNNSSCLAPNCLYPNRKFRKSNWVFQDTCYRTHKYLTHLRSTPLSHALALSLNQSLRSVTA